jgi:hypothetical protein
MVIEIVVVVAAMLAAGTAAAVKWDEIVIALKGKRFAILGERAVGKTCLQTFLTTGKLPEIYIQTLAPRKTASRRVKIEELDLAVKEGFDVSGDEVARGEWKVLVDQSEVVLYLLRADHLMTGNTRVEDRVRSDLRHIGGWIDARPRHPCFLIVGTHCDLDSNFDPDRLAAYVDAFRRLLVVKELISLAGGETSAKVVLGSLKTEESTEILVYAILQYLAAMKC